MSVLCSFSYKLVNVLAFNSDVTAWPGADSHSAKKNFKLSKKKKKKRERERETCRQTDRQVSIIYTCK